MESSLSRASPFFTYFLPRACYPHCHNCDIVLYWSQPAVFSLPLSSSLACHAAAPCLHRCSSFPVSGHVWVPAASPSASGRCSSADLSRCTRRRSRRNQLQRDPGRRRRRHRRQHCRHPPPPHPRPPVRAAAATRRAGRGSRPRCASHPKSTPARLGQPEYRPLLPLPPRSRGVPAYGLRVWAVAGLAVIGARKERVSGYSGAWLRWPVLTWNNVAGGRGNEIGEDGALAVARGVAKLEALETLDLGCVPRPPAAPLADSDGLSPPVPCAPAP
jgi:hypothetical protein